jgi:hypothetical protein
MARCSGTISLRFGRSLRFASTRVAAALAGPALSLFLGGCIPFATPHLLQTNSRGDVGAGAQQRLEIGTSTRADVLLALGAPDGRAVGDSWFTYGSARTAEVGGFLFLLVDGVAAEHVNTQVSRLLIRFDAQGIVSKVDLQQGECSGFMIAQGCLDLRGRELTAADSALAHGYGIAVLSFPEAQIRHGLPGQCEVSPQMAESHGPLAITDRAVVLGDAALEYSQIEEVFPVRRQAWDSWVALKGRDGVCMFIHTPESAVSAPRVHDAVLQGWQAAKAEHSPQ